MARTFVLSPLNIGQGGAMDATNHRMAWRRVLWACSVLTLVSLLWPLSLLADDCVLTDGLSGYRTVDWTKAHCWTIGESQACWQEDHIQFADGLMTITLDKNKTCTGADCATKPYASGEYRSNRYFGYGRYEVQLKAARGSGAVTTFFTRNDEYNVPPGGNGKPNEIDIEILGRDPTKLQINFFTNGVGHHERMIDLGFDAAAAFHRYAFLWTETGIRWYVDGTVVCWDEGSHRVCEMSNKSSDPTPNATPAHGGPQKLIMSLWVCNDPYWCGAFDQNSTLQAQYDWVNYWAQACFYVRLPIILRSS
jgi:endo-1,3-1,4-beta-glycanase ExoK